MTDDVLERMVVALAAPIVRHQQADDRRLGGGLDADRARRLLEQLFAIRTARDVHDVLGALGRDGERSHWIAFCRYANDAQEPSPRDHDIVRKLAFTIAYRDEVDDRGLVAFDAMRACAIAGWAFAAGLLSRTQAVAAVASKLLDEVVALHASWPEIAAQLRLAYRFTEGTLVPDLQEVLHALETGEGPWRDLPWPAAAAEPWRDLPWPPRPPTAAAAAAAAAAADDDDDDDLDLEDDDDEGSPVLLSLQLTIDCPGCGMPLWPASIAEAARCRHCATEVRFAASDWAHTCSPTVKRIRRDPGDDPCTVDVGDRFFVRAEAHAVAAVACSCGASLGVPTAPGELACTSCGLVHVVQDPDDNARAIHPRILLVIEPRPGRRRDAPDSACCAGCAAVIRAIDATARIVRCTTCDRRTFIDDTTWFAWHGAPRRPVWYLLLR